MVNLTPIEFDKLREAYLRSKIENTAGPHSETIKPSANSLDDAETNEEAK